VINIEADKGRADHVVSCSKCGYGEKMSFDAVDGEVTQREDARTYVNN
jgi:predicted nucleic-acid-binding Zn-ribbon protein